VTGDDARCNLGSASFGDRQARVDLPTNAFMLKQLEEAFYHGVVVAVAATTRVGDRVLVRFRCRLGLVVASDTATSRLVVNAGCSRMLIAAES
jgi:hypothetical protein